MKYCAQSLTYFVDLLFYKMKGWTKNSLLVFPDVNYISITSQFRWMPLRKTKNSAEGIDNKMDMCSSGARIKKEKFNLAAWDISKEPG